MHNQLAKGRIFGKMTTRALKLLLFTASLRNVMRPRNSKALRAFRFRWPYSARQQGPQVGPLGV